MFQENLIDCNGDRSNAANQGSWGADLRGRGGGGERWGFLGNWPEEKWNTNWAYRIPGSVLGYSQIEVDWFWSLITRFLANLTFDFYNKYCGIHASKPKFMIFYSRFLWFFFLYIYLKYFKISFHLMNKNKKILNRSYVLK